MGTKGPAEHIMNGWVNKCMLIFIWRTKYHLLHCTWDSKHQAKGNRVLPQRLKHKSSASAGQNHLVLRCVGVSQNPEHHCTQRYSKDVQQFIKEKDRWNLEESIHKLPMLSPSQERSGRAYSSFQQQKYTNVYAIFLPRAAYQRLGTQGFIASKAQGHTLPCVYQNSRPQKESRCST